MSMPLKETVQVIKSNPEHVSNLGMSGAYGVSVFLEHQYLVFMTVAYLVVTIYRLRAEAHELHDCTKVGKHEK